MSTSPSVPTISRAELQQLLHSGRNFRFWNVLTDQYFKGESITGSERVPLDKIGAYVAEQDLSKDEPIVTYCAGPNCPQSALAAEKLLKLGFTHVRAYEGGIEDWKAASLPITTLVAA